MGRQDSAAHVGAGGQPSEHRNGDCRTDQRRGTQLMPDRNGEDAAPHGPRVSGDDWCRPPGWRRPRSWSSPRSTPACLPTAAAAVVVALTVAALTLWCAALLRVLRADRA